MFVLAIGDRFNWRFGLQAIFWLVITTLLAVLGKKKIMLEYSNSNQTIKFSSKGEHQVYGIKKIKSIKKTSQNNS